MNSLGLYQAIKLLCIKEHSQQSKTSTGTYGGNIPTHISDKELISPIHKELLKEQQQNGLSDFKKKKSKGFE